MARTPNIAAAISRDSKANHELAIHRPLSKLVGVDSDSREGKLIDLVSNMLFRYGIKYNAAQQSISIGGLYNILKNPRLSHPQKKTKR